MAAAIPPRPTVWTPELLLKNYEHEPEEAKDVKERYAAVFAAANHDLAWSVYMWMRLHPGQPLPEEFGVQQPMVQQVEIQRAVNQQPAIHRPEIQGPEIGNWPVRERFLVFNPLSQFWTWRAIKEDPKRVFSLGVMYVCGMGGYMLALPFRVAMLAKEIFHLPLAVFQNLCHKGGRNFFGKTKVRVVCLTGASLKVFSGIAGIICPLLAYWMDDKIQGGSRTLRENTRLRGYYFDRGAIREGPIFQQIFVENIQGVLNTNASNPAPLSFLPRLQLQFLAPHLRSGVGMLRWYFNPQAMETLAAGTPETMLRVALLGFLYSYRESLQSNSRSLFLRVGAPDGVGNGENWDQLIQRGARPIELVDMLILKVVFEFSVGNEFEATSFYAGAHEQLTEQLQQINLDAHFNALYHDFSIWANLCILRENELLGSVITASELMSYEFPPVVHPPQVRQLNLAPPAPGAPIPEVPDTEGNQIRMQKKRDMLEENFLISYFRTGIDILRWYFNSESLASCSPDTMKQVAFIGFLYSFKARIQDKKNGLFLDEMGGYISRYIPNQNYGNHQKNYKAIWATLTNQSQGGIAPSDLIDLLILRAVQDSPDNDFVDDSRRTYLVNRLKEFKSNDNNPTLYEQLYIAMNCMNIALIESEDHELLRVVITASGLADDPEGVTHPTEDPLPVPEPEAGAAPPAGE